MGKKINNMLLLEYNLQLFAEESSSGEKTEKPTQRRKEKAREEGQVAKSNEITTALLFIIIFSMLKIIGSSSIQSLVEFIKKIYSLFSVKEITIAYALSLARFSVIQMIKIILPILLAALLIGLMSNFIQVGWHPTIKPIMPKLNNINPINGFKRIFSMRSVIELIKSILKITIILTIAYMSLKDYENLIITIYSLSVIEAYKLIVNLCLDIGIKIGVFFIIVAIIDYIYQRFSLFKKLKMTKHEVKEEYKQIEGNPEIKSKIRQKMRQISMRRMMQDLPKADVIITNPTHFAVAISYEQDKHTAPVIIAKGADFIALKIKEVAKENETPIVENKPLARTLYYTVEIGDEIPPELYHAVAEILAFVYKLKHSKEGGSV